MDGGTPANADANCILAQCVHSGSYSVAIMKGICHCWRQRIEPRCHMEMKPSLA